MGTGTGLQAKLAAPLQAETGAFELIGSSRRAIEACLIGTIASALPTPPRPRTPPTAPPAQNTAPPAPAPTPHRTSPPSRPSTSAPAPQPRRYTAARRCDFSTVGTG